MVAFPDASRQIYLCLHLKRVTAIALYTEPFLYYWWLQNNSATSAECCLCSLVKQGED